MDEMTPIEQAIYDWLGEKKVAMWCDWYIEDPQRRTLAAKWFAKERADFVKWYTEQQLKALEASDT